MKKVSLFLMSLMVIMTVGLASCTEKETQKSPEIQVVKRGSVVIDMKVKHLSGFDQLETSKAIYDERGVLVKTVYVYDSLPSMGMTRDTLVVTNSAGDEKDTIVTHPKDYQLFITVTK